MKKYNPILRFTDGSNVVDILEDWEIADPYWRPQIAQYKGGGAHVNPGIAEGQRLVHKEYDNVIETIPLVARGTDQDKCIQTIRGLLQLGRQASDYWTEIYEFDDVWMEVKPACNDCLTGYARLIKMSLPELGYPFGQPFFAATKSAVMDGLTLTIEREPLWRGVPPGTIIGPLYNLIKNPDFELWNTGVVDSQPDSWSDLETVGITGTNNRQDTAVHGGQYALKIDVTASTQNNRAKGVTQIISGTRANTLYTVIAWVRSDGITNGVGRMLITYSGQLEVYRSAVRHGWTLYTGTFTTGSADVVGITLEILKTSTANGRGTVYFDSLMLLEGDWEQEAIDGVLPYLSSSHIVNHWDQPGAAVVEAGDINYVDVWSVPGDEDALIRLEIQNNTAPADATNPIENYNVIRVGMRRTQDIFRFNNYHDPAGLTDTTASSDDYLQSPNLNLSWQDITTKIVTDTIHNQGRYRVLARIQDPAASGNPTLKLRLNYFVGTANIGEKILNDIIAPVRQQWFIANLTPNAAMNQDNKFSTDVPTQLGYTVQMNRDAGTDKGYLDYVLTMPTDGGYLEASLNPILTYGNALIIDNTASQTVGATMLRSGIRIIYERVSAVNSIQSFRGDAYFGRDTNQIIRLQAGAFSTQTLPASSSSDNAMAVYNGDLYAAGSTSGRVSKTTDGVTWATAFNTGGTAVAGLIPFNGKLYIAVIVAGGMQIHSWNGTTLTTVYNRVGDTDIGGFGIYGNFLYANTVDAAGTGTVIHRLDPNSGNWTVFQTIALGVAFRRFVPFKGKLYGVINTGAVTGPIYSFSGTTFSVAATLAFNIADLTVHNNQLWIIGGAAVAGGIAVFNSDDGITWHTFFNDTSITTGLGNKSILEVNGILYITAPGIFRIYTISDTDVIYKVANWQGVLFASPPQKRHRFFFNYDRANFINNIDDKALIGLGFVPRYLSLRGHG